jgi:hypothetical protein
MYVYIHPHSCAPPWTSAHGPPVPYVYRYIYRHTDICIDIGRRATGQSLWGRARALIFTGDRRARGGDQLAGALGASRRPGRECARAPGGSPLGRRRWPGPALRARARRPERPSPLAAQATGEPDRPTLYGRAGERTDHPIQNGPPASQIRTRERLHAR